MEEKNFWEEINNLGKLYTEVELIVSIEPVLAVCISESNEKYLVMIYDSYDCVYIMRKITDMDLLKMLKNEIPVEEVFRNSEEILKTYIDSNGSINYDTFDAKFFDENMLPKKGELFELENFKIMQYINYLEERVKGD